MIQQESEIIYPEREMYHLNLVNIMKNKLKFYPCRLGKDLHRIVRIMKVTGIIILAALMQVTASVYSQTKLLTLKEKNITIESALKEIEKQSEFFFLYNNKQIDVTQKIDIDVT